MTNGLIAEKPYKWQYVAVGNSIECRDNTKYSGTVVAMCACYETAKIFADVINGTRKKDSIL